MIVEPFFLFRMTAGDLSVTVAIIGMGYKVYSVVNTRFVEIEKRVGILENDAKIQKPKVDSLWSNLMAEIAKKHTYRTQIELEKAAIATKGDS